MTALGRHEKLTSELIEQVKSYISAGNCVKAVCQYIGVSESTWFRWIERGEKETGSIYYDFLESVRSAESAAEIRAVTGIVAAGKKDWKALAWFLERKYPEKWGKKKEDEVDDLNTIASKFSGRVSKK